MGVGAKFEFGAEIWRYPGKGGWHFITVPRPLSLRIKAEHGGLDQGWGSLPVKATIASSAWKTSLFPDTKSGCYLLPVKAAVRRKIDVKEGDTVDVVVEIAPGLV